MARARVKLAKNLDSLLLSEFEEVITQANLGDEDTEIAKLCLINAMAQEDVAAEIGCTRGKVGKHLKKILERLEKTAARMGY